VFLYDLMKENIDKLEEDILTKELDPIEYPNEKSYDDIIEIMIRWAKYGYGLDVNKNIELSRFFKNKGI